ncbi:MAG: glycosyltransferase family 4 protein [Clostridia bacterium]|nr:glycosyltransferase family 4 protein [Clostridia bacterium]
MTKIAIHQFAANLSFGDAISNDMLEIQAALIRLGYDSKIYAQYMDPQMSEYFNLFTEYKGDSNNLIFFHASIGGDIFDLVKNLPDRKILIYHNITPSSFFRGYNEHLANLLDQGECKLKEIFPYLSFAVGDSDFNRNDLVKMGFSEEKTDVLPIFLDFKKYDSPLNSRLQKDLKADGIKNILFVGRFAPNKRHEDLIKAFYVYHRYFNHKSRLIMVGGHSGMENYYLRLKKLIKILGMEEFVVLGEQVSFEDLVTYYKTADLFLSMSEHEGFFVPILECFYLGVPVLAYFAAAVPETMGGAGVIFKEKNLKNVAVMMDQLITDNSFKTKTINSQKQLLDDFKRDVIEQKLKLIINKVLSSNI